MDINRNVSINREMNIARDREVNINVSREVHYGGEAISSSMHAQKANRLVEINGRASSVHQ